MSIYRCVTKEQAEYMHNHADRFIDVRAVAGLVGVAPVTIRRWCKFGKFPYPFLLPWKSVRWDKKEIMEWVSENSRYEDEVVVEEKPCPKAKEKVPTKADKLDKLFDKLLNLLDKKGII